MKKINGVKLSFFHLGFSLYFHASVPPLVLLHSVFTIPNTIWAHLLILTFIFLKSHFTNIHLLSLLLQPLYNF